MISGKRPIEHFREMVSDAVKRQAVKTAEETEFYISTLLTDFVAAERLTGEPLAITFIKALESEKIHRERLLKRLGDISLFTSGFFSDSLKRKTIDIDYYIAMGENAYGNLAAIHRASPLHTLFSELEEKFRLFADVISEVSERSRLTSSRDILRIYERWLRTKSTRAEQMLRELGIEPHRVNTAPIQ